jgi:hypothetical protein
MRKGVFLCWLLCGIIFHPISADLVTFDGLAGADIPGYDYKTSSYTKFSATNNPTASIDGWDYTTGDLEYFIVPDFAGDDLSDNPYNGTDYLVSKGPSGSAPDLTISRTDGGAFSLSSLDVGLWGNYTGLELVVTGEMAGVDLVFDQSFIFDDFANNDPDNMGNDFEHLTLTNPGFDNVESVSFSLNGGKFIAVDNIDMSAVPEPGIFLLLATGLMSIVTVGLRRKKQ